MVVSPFDIALLKLCIGVFSFQNNLNLCSQGFSVLEQF